MTSLYRQSGVRQAAPTKCAEDPSYILAGSSGRKPVCYQEWIRVANHGRCLDAVSTVSASLNSWEILPSRDWLALAGPLQHPEGQTWACSCMHSARRPSNPQPLSDLRNLSIPAATAETHPEPDQNFKIGAILSFFGIPKPLRALQGLLFGYLGAASRVICRFPHVCLAPRFPGNLQIRPLEPPTRPTMPAKSIPWPACCIGGTLRSEAQ